MLWGMEDLRHFFLVCRIWIQKGRGKRWYAGLGNHSPPGITPFLTELWTFPINSSSTHFTGEGVPHLSPHPSDIKCEGLNLNCACDFTLKLIRLSEEYLITDWLGVIRKGLFFFGPSMIPFEKGNRLWKANPFKRSLFWKFIAFEPKRD